MTADTGDVPFSPLIAQIITAQYEVTRRATDQFVDTLTYQLAEAHAYADTIQYEVLALLDGPYVPHADVIRRALFPNRETVNRYRRREHATT